VSFLAGVANFWLDEEGIVRGECVESADLTLENTEEMLRSFVAIRKGVHPLLMNVARVRSVSRDARRLLASPETGALVHGVAVVVATPVSRVIGNLYLTLNQPTVPTRLFDTQDEGLAWLREQFRSALRRTPSGGPPPERMT